MPSLSFILPEEINNELDHMRADMRISKTKIIEGLLRYALYHSPEDKVTEYITQNYSGLRTAKDD